MGTLFGEVRTQDSRYVQYVVSESEYKYTDEEFIEDLDKVRPLVEPLMAEMGGYLGEMSPDLLSWDDLDKTSAFNYARDILVKLLRVDVELLKCGVVSYSSPKVNTVALFVCDDLRLKFMHPSATPVGPTGYGYVFDFSDIVHAFRGIVSDLHSNKILGYSYR